MNMRWVEREGKMILQYCVAQPIEEWKSDPHGGPIQFKVLKAHKYTWYDVPVCNEETGEELEEK